MSNFSNSPTIGWDIGGAHLKAVLLNAKGEVIDCLQLSCPLWKGLDYLQRAILHALQAFKIKPCDVNRISACHAITMTGELVDLFENRHQGVCEIAKTASDLLGENVWFYAAVTDEIVESQASFARPNFIRQNFINLGDVHHQTSRIASANWHASACCVALQAPNALFVDIGSTTTDIIAIAGGKVVSEGISDAYRMAADSLVYTGVVRTPVMALAQKLPFEDDNEMLQVNVAAEYFATMADVYRLTGEIETDDAETADGKGKTQLESVRRLARMIGHDVDLNLEKWIKLAFACRSIHVNQIKTAMQKQLKPNMLIIGAGAGSFLVKAIAADLKHEFKHACEATAMRPTGHIDLSMQHQIEVCFPAYAVAYLAQKYQR